MRFAFLQRADSKAETHKMIGSFTVETHAFLTQMNLSLPNCWATLRDVVNTVANREEHTGEYLYLKEPTSVSYRLIKMTDEDEDS
jgi:hypothetical protein